MVNKNDEEYRLAEDLRHLYDCFANYEFIELMWFTVYQLR